MNITRKELLLLSLVFIPLSVVQVFAVLYFNLNYFYSIVLFMGAPTIFLYSRLRKNALPSLDIVMFSGLFLLWAIPYTYLAHLNEVWFETTMFTFRVFNFPLESLLFAFLYVYIVFAFIRLYFVPHSQQRLNLRKFKYVSVVFFLAFLLLASLELLEIPYFYFWSNLFSVAVILILGWRLFFLKQGCFKKACLISLLAMPPFVLFEYTALTIGNWSFPYGNHVAYVPFIADFYIPIEEWMFAILTPICVYVLYLRLSEK